MSSIPRSFAAAIQLATVSLLFGFFAPALGAEPLIRNGNFLKWTDKLPDDWKVEIGAKNGADSPKSEVKPIKGPALMLRGQATTMAWHTVSQEFPAEVGESYTLAFESRVKDIKREGRQFNNCYVGLISLGDAGKPVAVEIKQVSDADWTKHRVTATVPEGASSTKVVIFLSKSGLLAVKNVAVTKSEPSDLPKSLLVNSDFREWADGVPKDWAVEIGAKNGANEPKSQVRQLDDPGLSLRGTQATMAWHSVSQSLSPTVGITYRLDFQARTENIQRQGRQRDNCYVGVIIFNANGQAVGKSIKDLSRGSGWRKHRIEFKTPPGAHKAEVIIFLSKSGTLAVKNLLLTEA